MAYVTVWRMHDGAYLGMRFEIDRWLLGEVRLCTIPACAQAFYDSPHIAAVAGKTLALTLDPSSDGVGMDISDPQRSLPRAVLITPVGCQTLGAGILTALRGSVAAGYIGTRDGKPSP